MNRIEIQYFAVLRERAGTGRETVETAAATAAELYDELATRHDFGLPRGMLRVAVNADMRIKQNGGGCGFFAQLQKLDGDVPQHCFAVPDCLVLVSHCSAGPDSTGLP